MKKSPYIIFAQINYTRFFHYDYFLSKVSNLIIKLANETNRKKYKLLIIIPAIFLVIALPSIVFQPYTAYKPSKNDQTYGINDLIQHTYIIQTKDGKYYLFDKDSNKKIATIKDIKKEPYNKIKVKKE